VAIARASRRPILGLGARLPRAAPSRRDFDDAVVIVIVVVVVIAVVVVIGSIEEEDENTLDRSRVDDRVARCRVVVDERRTIPDSRFPINQSDPRHPTTRACFFFVHRGWGRLTTDHDSSLTPPPPQISLSTDDKKHVDHPHRSNAPNDRTDRTDRSTEPTDRSRRHSRARRWRHDDHLDDHLDDDLDDDDDDAVVGGVEERGETGRESSGERVGGIGTTRYGR
jgi:hypothetical protein